MSRQLGQLLISHMPRALIVAFLMMLAGCNQQAMLQKFASAEDQAFAKKQIQTLKAGEFESIDRIIDPSLKTSLTPDTYAKMAAAIPAGEPLSVTLVGAHKNFSPNATTVNLTYEYQYPDNWLVINVASLKKADKVTIVGFRVLPQSQSLKESHRFTLAGKSAVQYTVLILAIAIPIFTLYALVLCIRTPFQGR